MAVLAPPDPNLTAVRTEQHRPGAARPHIDGQQVAGTHSPSASRLTRHRSGSPATNRRTSVASIFPP